MDDEGFGTLSNDASGDNTNGLTNIPISTDTNLDFMDGFAD